jgi:hypothetical protein
LIAFERRKPRPSWAEQRVGLGASLAVHVALAAVWAAIATPRRLDDAPPRAVEVELVVEASSQPAQPSPHPAVERPASERSPPERLIVPAKPPAPALAADGLIRAERLVSDDILRDRRSREARAALRRFSLEDRMLQLCGLEAMAQIAMREPSFHADRVAAHASAAPKISGVHVMAEGAAAHAVGKTPAATRWAALRFDCALSEDRAQVVAFAFALGADIPRQRWEEFGLPTETGRHE